MRLKEVKFVFDSLCIRVSELVTGNLKIIVDDKSSVVIAKDKIDKLDEITGLNIAPTIKYLFEDVE